MARLRILAESNVKSRSRHCVHPYGLQHRCRCALSSLLWVISSGATTSENNDNDTRHGFYMRGACGPGVSILCILLTLNVNPLKSEQDAQSVFTWLLSPFHIQPDTCSFIYLCFHLVSCEITLGLIACIWYYIPSRSRLWRTSSWISRRPDTPAKWEGDKNWAFLSC